jgi:hypothetical protein
VARWRALFEPPGLSDFVVEQLLRALFAIDLEWLAANPRTPWLYQSGVRYERERYERWRSIPVCLAELAGDCEDLACWRAAEIVLREGDSQARPIWTKRYSPKRNGWLYHIVVRRGDGRLEDPSRLLGMGEPN